MDGEKPSIRNIHIWGCLIEARPYRPHEENLDFNTLSFYFFGYTKRFRMYKFFSPTTRFFFKMRSARFLEEIEFAGKENIRGVVFNEERVIHNRQVFVCTIAQEIELVINNNVIPNIIQEQEKVKKKRKKQRENM